MHIKYDYLQTEVFLVSVVALSQNISEIKIACLINTSSILKQVQQEPILPGIHIIAYRSRAEMTTTFRVQQISLLIFSLFSLFYTGR